MSLNANNKKTRRSKRDIVLDAATQVFLESPFAAVSVDLIAKRAGVSKATIYAHFDSKVNLFEEVINRRAETFWQIPEIPSSIEETADYLRTLATFFVEQLTKKETLGIFRQVIGSATSFPDLAEVFYRAGPARGIALFEQRFMELGQQGFLNITNPRLTAEMFMSMLKGGHHMRCLLQMKDGSVRAEEVIEETVRIMMTSYGPNGAP
ncbi:MAG: TetR/AcrR family transcriptional regulator [Terasakiella sp.]|uniref:TetR/AcrR family transcriptional regulator n=1 Tax=unclassified Terasakiella TaxID=2614952 RepID=UPI003B00B5F2